MSKKNMTPKHAYESSQFAVELLTTSKHKVDHAIAQDILEGVDENYTKQNLRWNPNVNDLTPEELDELLRTTKQ